MVGIQTEIVSGLPLRSPEIKSHLDVGVAKKHKEYYIEEGGGFPWIRAMMSLVNLESLVICPSTKGAPESELTNLLVSLMQIRMSN